MKKIILTYLFATFALLISRQLGAQNYIFHWIAGNGVLGFVQDSVAATTTEIYNPGGMITDPLGNLYFADNSANRIRIVNTSGTIYTIAGNGSQGYTGDGGPASAAELSLPEGIVMDSKGNIYIADTWNQKIRKINSSGIISTIAGSSSGFSGDGGPATAAKLNSPYGLALDKYGDLFIADGNNNRVREIDTNGIISTVAGNGTGSYSGDGGPAIAAEISSPWGVIFDTSGNLLISDLANYRIREVNTSGIISTIAGNGTSGYNGDGGQATAAAIGAPAGLAFDALGNLYACNSRYSHIRKINTSGVISTVAGSTTFTSYFGDGGQATAAGIDYSTGITFDASGNYYFGEAPYNHRIRKVNTSGIISTVAGNGDFSYYGDGGQATNAQIYFPYGVSSDNAGNVYIADYWNQRIRKVNTSGIITTIAGNGSQGYTGDGGPAMAAELEDPGGVCVNSSGNIYIADWANYRVRKVSALGTISTIAGDGIGGYSGDGGQATAAEIGAPWVVSSDAAGNIYSTDQGSRVRKVNASGIITTIAGNGTMGYSGDGGQATAAEINDPMQVAFDGAGNVYIADQNNYRVRKINPSGIISTIAGNGTLGYSGDGGQATAAKIGEPHGLTVDAAGNIYIGDYVYRVIRKVNTSGIITTIAGGGPYFCVQGVPALSSQIGQVDALSLDAAGNIYSADHDYNRIYKFTPTPILTATSSQKNVSCSGSCNGSAWAISSGGAPPYTYNWTPSGGTKDTAVNLCAGTYTCSVKDAAANTTTVSVIITQPPLLTVTTGSLVNIACNGAHNGSITAIPSGGTGAYSYLWAPTGGTSATVSNLTAGCYTVTVVDNNGCTATATACITQPTALTVTIISVINEICNGEKIGSLTANPSGGTFIYTYVWSTSPVQIGAVATGLSAGCYTVTVTDANGCTATASACVTQPAPLTVTTSINNNVLCFGGNSGSITANPLGGTGAYTYSWIPTGIITATASGLTAGCYTVTVTDNNGCTATAMTCITQPTVLTDSIIITSNVLCNGGNNGILTADPSGGTATYTYLWNNGATTAAASNLTAGCYTVTVVDNNGCTITTSTCISQPATSVNVSASSAGNVLCNGGNNGTDTANAMGGTPPYNYSWNTFPIQTNAIANGLSAGCYTVTVTDNNGCSATANTCITQPPLLTINTSPIVNISCNGGINGSITAAPSGGTGVYTYLWTPALQTSVTVTGLSAGCYTVTITDANGCTATASACVSEPPVLVISMGSIVNIACNGGNNGSITATPSGGTAGYTYTWSTGATIATVSNLTAGCYTVTVTDNNGCTASASICITQPLALTDSIRSTYDTICPGNCATLFNLCGNGTSPYTYEWIPGGLTSDSITACPHVSTMYTCQVTDSHGCKDTITFKLIVNLAESPLLNAAKDSVCISSTTDSLFGTRPMGGTYSGAGVSGNNFNASIAGSGAHTIYYVVASPGCNDTATTVITVEVCTGINEVSALDELIKFYPNPFSQSVNVYIGIDGPINITMFNMIGQNMGTWQMDKGLNTIDASAMPSGVYIIEVKTKNGILNKKLVKVN